MNGYHSSTILCTIVADPDPITHVRANGNDINGCDIRVVINQTSYVDGRWVEYPRWINLTAWYSMADKLLKAKWCKKGYHALFVCRTKERAYKAKDGSTKKTLDSEILDAHPILVGQDASGQAKARANAHVETQRAPQQQSRITQPYNTPQSTPPPPAQNNLMDEDIPF